MYRKVRRWDSTYRELKRWGRMHHRNMVLWHETIPPCICRVKTAPHNKTVTTHPWRRPRSNWPPANKNSTSFPCRYRQKAGFACPWKTAPRTRQREPAPQVTHTRRLMQKAHGTTWQPPDGAWAPEVDIIRGGVYIYNLVIWSSNCVRSCDDYINEPRISVILYIIESLHW